MFVAGQQPSSQSVENATTSFTSGNDMQAAVVQAAFYPVFQRRFQYGRCTGKVGEVVVEMPRRTQSLSIIVFTGFSAFLEADNSENSSGEARV
jgi:hypothetical protein